MIILKNSTVRAVGYFVYISRKISHEKTTIKAII